MIIKITNLSGKHLKVLESFNMVSKSVCSTLASVEDNRTYDGVLDDRTYDVVLKDTVSIHTNCQVWLETTLHKYSLDCTDFSEVIIL